MEQNTGIKSREKIAEKLSGFLADTYALYLKTQYYHWNVKGKHFYQLHNLFEEQYTELAGAVDEIAERITQLGYRAPGSFAEFSKLKSVHESTSVPKPQDMVEEILKDNELVISKAREIIRNIEDYNDDVTVDLLTQRMAVHEKAAWMMRSSVE